MRSSKIKTMMLTFLFEQIGQLHTQLHIQRDDTTAPAL
jgi:hypothetical protein